MTQSTSPRRDSASGAPEPESAGKPDAPTRLTKRSWKYVLVKTVREFTDDQCVDLAAALTFFSVLALFPGVIAVFSLLALLGQSGTVADAMTRVVENLAPESASDILQKPLEQAAGSGSAGLGLVVGILLAIWTASGYVGAFTRALNRIYEIDEGRPVWKLKPVQLLITLVTVVLVTVAGLLLAASGPVARAIGSAFGLSEAVVTVWSIVKWPVLLFIIVLIVALLYYASPNVKQPKFRWISPGAVLAIVVLGLATLGFGLYVSNFSNYDRTYGSLAGVIVFLLWLWIANLALLFGAEFDAEMERGRQLQAGIVAEEDIQLPARDDRKIEKSRETERKDLAEGRGIRLDAERPGSADGRTGDRR